MTYYELIVFLHVLSAIAWVGGGMIMQMLSLGAKRAEDPAAQMHYGRQAEEMSRRYFMPASFAVLGFGIWATIIGPWSFGDLWITLGLVGYALSALIGMAGLGPLAKRAQKLTEERGPMDPVVLHTRRRMERLTRLDLVILVAVIFDMVVKPGV